MNLNKLNNTKERIGYHLDNRISILSSYEETINQCNTLPRYMELKKSVMREILSTLPLGTSTCPFCAIHANECKKCWYGEQKGPCEMENDDAYTLLVKANLALADPINLYWTNADTEKYDSERGTKIPKNVIALCKEDLVDTVIEVIEDCKRAKELLEQSTKVSSFMWRKVQFMVMLIHDFPLNWGSCPFCIHHDGECKRCWYGENKGFCTLPVDAPYHRMIEARDGLIGAINNYWTLEDMNKYGEVEI